MVFKRRRSSTEPSEQLTEREIVARLSFVGIAGNILLSVVKLLAGVFGHSGAMVSDAVHSLSDVLATFIAYLGVKSSQAPPDRRHPYGHEQLENLTTLALGVALLATGVMMGYSALCHLISGNYADLPGPTRAPVFAALISIVSKEAMYWYARYYALKINSSAFLADAQHHRSDALSSVGALIGIVGARLGFRALDPLAAIIICLMILWVAYGILKECLAQLIDAACDEQFETSVRRCIERNTNVDHIDLLRTRRFGKRVFVEVEIAVDGNCTLWEAHRIAHEVHNAVEREFQSVKHIMVHVNPAQLNDADGDLSVEAQESLERTRKERLENYERLRDAKSEKEE